MNEVEVFELSDEEWNEAIDRRLCNLGLTRQQLRDKHSKGMLNAEEFKLYMLLPKSSI
jgi:hypothetical protein